MLFELYRLYQLLSISNENVMKKLILNMLLLFGITVTVAAQAYDPIPMAVTPANQVQNSAWYQASQNAYASEVYTSYWAWDKTSSTWVKRVELVVPATHTPDIIVDPRYKINYNGGDVCKSDACLIKTKTNIIRLPF
jgi:hypothetical protein